MSTNPHFSAFDTPYHNPSIYEVRSQSGRGADLIDFCVPANSYFPPPQLLALIKDNLTEVLKYYPDYAPVQQGNIARIADVDAAHIIPANGVTELITILCRTCAAPVITDTPTFGRWTDLPMQYGTPIHFIERDSSLRFNLSVAQICARVEAVGAQTLVISNPNNPTGAWLTEMEMDELIMRLAHLSLIVIDESFIDFSGMRSAERLAAESHNTVVVKSLGKALGWHGIRLGYGVANLTMAEKLRTQVPYWNINGLASFVLKHLGDFMDEYRQSFRKVARDRDYMLQQLQSISWLTTYPSKANFLLSEVPATISGKQLRNWLLAEHGLFVRECSNKIGSSESFLRNVVRRPADIDRLVAALRQVLTH